VTALIDYDKIKDNGHAATIKNLENKPYIKYLRYLLSKGFSPSATTMSLYSLGYPSVSIPNVVIYFENVIMPVANEFKVKKVYSKYIKNLSKDNVSNYQAVAYNDLSYDQELQTNFCKFLKGIDVIELWTNEIKGYYINSGCDIPIDDDGEPLVSEACSTANLEALLAHPKRHIIDQLLLDGLSVDKTLKKLKEEHMVKDVFRGDLVTYAKCFFNYQKKSMEDLAEQVSSEIIALEYELDELDNRNLTMPEKYVAKQEMEKRIQFLKHALMVAKADGSMMAFNYGSIELTNMIEMFKDVFMSNKQLYDFHKVFTEREGIPALNGIVKNMQVASDQIVKLLDKQGASKITAKEALLEIIKQRHDEIQRQKEVEAMGEEVDFDDIGNSDSV
jgi:hypothetical protein